MPREHSVIALWSRDSSGDWSDPPLAGLRTSRPFEAPDHADDHPPLDLALCRNAEGADTLSGPGVPTCVGHNDYHAFITDRDGETLELEADHRRHAEVENAIRDLKEGVGLEHLPSGRFAANGA